MDNEDSSGPQVSLDVLRVNRRLVQAGPTKMEELLVKGEAAEQVRLGGQCCGCCGAWQVGWADCLLKAASVEGG